MPHPRDPSHIGYIIPSDGTEIELLTLTPTTTRYQLYILLPPNRESLFQYQKTQGLIVRTLLSARVTFLNSENRILRNTHKIDLRPTL